MNRVKAGSAAVAVLSVAGLLAGCGKDAASERLREWWAQQPESQG